MKIWEGFGSEHSANLIMIGRFKEVKNAKETLLKIEKLKEQVQKESQSGDIVVGGVTDRYTDEMMKLFGELKIHSLGPSDLEQLAFDVSIEHKEKELILTTDEVDVAAFFKILVLEGAKVEMYSRHDYPEENNTENI